jgi:hypothetical protein
VTHRLLLTGGRRFDDRELLATWLWLFRGAYGEFELAVGYNPNDPKFQGLDQIAYEYAKANGIRGRCFPALWQEQGDAAGPIRNRLMLDRFGPAGRQTRNFTI